MAGEASDERYKQISGAYTTLSKHRKEYEYQVCDELNRILQELTDIEVEHGL